MKMLKILFVILFTFAMFILYILYSTGFFYKAKDDWRYKEIYSLPMVGAEDMVALSDTSFLVSSDDRFATIKGSPKQGALYIVYYHEDKIISKNISSNFQQEFHPHGIDIYPLNDSVNQVLVVNHTKKDRHTIEVFNLMNEQLLHKNTIEHNEVYQPNDVVIKNANSFYFTNDHGEKAGFKRELEDLLGLNWSNVVYVNGEKFIELAKDIAYANGIARDKKRELLYVASTRDQLIKVYHSYEDGKLEYIESIDCSTGVDNITLDKEGTLWVACHPNLLRFGSYIQSKSKLTPSEIITIDYKGKGDYLLEHVFENKGDIISGSSVVIPMGNKIIIGSVADNQISLLEKQ